MGTRREFLFGRRAAPSSPAAQVSDACFELHGIVCGNCRDACEARAVRILPLGAGLAKAVVDPDLCTGCGECVSACPAGAIVVAAANAGTSGSVPAAIASPPSRE